MRPLGTGADPLSRNDQRPGARFRASAPVPRRRSSSRILALAFLASLLVAAPVLTGCTSVESTEGSSGGGAPAPAAPEFSDGDDAGGKDAPARREVVVTGTLYLTVAEPLTAANEAARIVERAGGRVDGRQEFAPRDVEEKDAYSEDLGWGYGYGPFPGGRAILELRIPSDRLTATLDELKQLGELEELALSSDDVTIEVRDLEARTGALRSSIERLLALQTAAADVADLIALESAISDRQAELESLEAQQRYYADQVSLSTIVLTLGSEESAPLDVPDSFWTGLSTGWESLLAFLGGSLVVLGVVLPWLLVLGVLGILAWAIARNVRGRRRSRIAASNDAAR
jgi:hypothetical protein